MSRWVIEGPRRFVGTLRPPSDKSITHRGVLFGALARGETIVHQPLASGDCLAMIAAVRALGATVTDQGPFWRITGVGERGFGEPTGVIDVGNAGTAIRLLAGAIAPQNIFAVLTGDASIRRRPMGRIVGPLRAMGARIQGRQGGDRAPLAIDRARLRGKIHRPSVASAQVKSSILLAGLGAQGDTTVIEPGPSRDHSERLLEVMGATITRQGSRITLSPGPLEGTELAVPADPSSAAFFLVGAACAEGSSLTLTDVGTNPTRTGLLDALVRMGGKISEEDAGVEAAEPTATLSVAGQALHGVEIQAGDLVRLIDEIPVLAIAAMAASGETIVHGGAELRVKESDRLKGTADLVAAFGGNATVEGDRLTIHGGSTLRPARVDSRGDHRIAMAAAIGACLASGKTEIEDTDCVATSYPDFLQDLEAVTERV